MPEVLGLDIGGANLKAAHSLGQARVVRFPLWKNPRGLTDALRALMEDMPRSDLWAVTMTGELCDCFTSKREGVKAILDCVENVAGHTLVNVWTTYGRFLLLQEARHEPLRVAAANWLAAATLAGTFAGPGPALYIDIGSTTTDIVALRTGKPAPCAWTDVDRLKCGELVYTGVRRTPLCSLLGSQVAAELFATTLDAYLALGLASGNEEDRDTADGRPATKIWAHGRLARMLGGDGESIREQETAELARAAMTQQTQRIAAAVRNVSQRMPEPPEVFVISGSGEFLARAVVETLGGVTISMGEKLGPHLSETACAYAVALLAKKQHE